MYGEMRMKVALCQLAIVFEEKVENTRRVLEFVKQAKSAGAELVLFPEMSLTGFSMNLACTGERERESVLRMCAVAKREGIAVGIGWTALAGEQGENHYTVISAQGEILSDYVKMHPFSYSHEDQYFVKGHEPAHFELADIPFSHFICYDLRFPEIFQCVSERAHVIIVAADWPGSRREHWKCLLQARAIENQCYILGVNSVGWQNGVYYTGDSCVILPDGRVAEQLEEKEGLILYDLKDDVINYRDAFPMKRDRRNDLYVELYEKD